MYYLNKLEKNKYNIVQPKKTGMSWKLRSIQVELMTYSNIAQNYSGSASPRINGAL